MKCPYCAEEVKDEALICRFCQRDVVLFRPILSRLSKMDEMISELRSAIDISPERTASATIDKASVATAASIAFATLTCLVTWHYPFFPEVLTKIFDKPLNFLSVASPFFAALWLGWSLPRLRVTAYLLLGVLPGLGGFVVWFVLQCLNLPPYPSSWKSNLLVYVASGPLWFLAGGTIGARTRKLRRRSPETPGEASTPEDQKQQNSQEMLTAVVKGVFAILTASIPYVFKK